MSLPRITSGERRGLIILVLVLIIATVVLCWRNYTRDFPDAREFTDAMASEVIVPSDSLLDSVRIPRRGDFRSIGSNDSVPDRVKKRSKAVRGQRKSRGVAPAQPRSPRDERVD